MNMIEKQNKKVLMGLAAILILLFHFHIPVTDSTLETIIYRGGYIGVDIFFLLSGASLIYSNTSNLKKYYLNRFLAIYPVLVIYAIVNCLVNSSSINTFIRIITFADFFKRGGGAYLWYLPGIIIIYLLSPLFKKLKEKFELKGLFISLIAWLVAVLLLQYVFKYTKVFILLNRIPVFLVGLYNEYFVTKDKKVNLIIYAILLVAGAFLFVNYCVLVRINKPIADCYYLIALPLVISLVFMVNYISDAYKSKLLTIFGKHTLHLYCLQMTFGYKLENLLLSLINQNSIAEILTYVVLLLLAILLDKINLYLRSLKK